MLSKEQISSRKKTLLVSLLLSMWAPLTTGIAMLLSESTTQMADFVRRTVEFIALFVSWKMFTYIHYGPGVDPGIKARLERIASVSVAVAMCTSGIVMLALTISRLFTYNPGGNVYPGLVIAILGLIANLCFWRRYTFLMWDNYSLIMDTQRQLYGAKACVDACVIIALATVALIPEYFITHYIDVFGSTAVSVYLIWSGIRVKLTGGRS